MDMFLPPSPGLEERSNFKLPGPPVFQKKLNFVRTPAPPIGVDLGSDPFRTSIREECVMGPGLNCQPLGFQQSFDNGCKILHLPQLQLQKFLGEAVEFSSFVQSFQNFVESYGQDDFRKLLYLQMYLTGKALKLIQGCSVHSDKPVGYRKAWELLHCKYCSNATLMKKVKDDLMKGSSIREFDSERSADIAIKMTNCKCLYESKGMLGELNGSEILDKILNRLPGKLQQHFAELSFYKQRQNSYGTFNDLLLIIRRVVSFAVTERLVTGVSKKRSACTCCGARHPLCKCDEFASRPVENRRLLVKEHALCFKCLRPGHQVNKCTFYRTCNVCKQNHNTLLHVNKDDKEETTIVKKDETNNVVALNSISKGGYKSILNSLPVNVWHGESSSAVVTYAMLDSGSTTSICESSLVA